MLLAGEVLKVAIQQHIDIRALVEIISVVIGIDIRMLVKIMEIMNIGGVSGCISGASEA